MRHAKVQYSPLALADLDDIWSYIADELSSPQAAERTVGAITSVASRLADFPDSGAPLSAIYPLATNYRYVVAGKYLVFYRHESIVYIDRILYSGRDYIKVLFGDEPKN